VSDEPTFDAEGYPTEATLRRIRRWSIQTNADFEAVMDFAGRAWNWPHLWVRERDWIDPDYPSFPTLRYVFSTGGWSGNESIVGAIEKNQMVQMIGAWPWRRGGHYEYRFPLVREEGSR